MAELQDSSVMVQMAYQAMLAMGVDTATVLSRMGITPAMLHDRHARTPHDAQLLFWSVLEEVTQDPDVGLHLGENMPVYQGQVLQYLFLSSATFGDGLSRALNYQRLLSDASQASMGEEGGMAYLHVDSLSPNVMGLRHLNECMVLGLISFFRYVTDQAFVPAKIEFSHASGGSAQEHERIFACPVHFGCEQTRLYFDAKVLQLPSSHAEPELLQLHEKLASEHVAKLERQDVVARVYRVLGEILETGEVTLDQVAARLAMKPRTLRTRLAEADTNFNQLLANYRCNLAKRLLTQTHESIDEIVYLTGFSEPSTFYRAFKRWTQMTPIEYRQRRHRS
ncbi:MAG: AraC family transcriptional regulator [Bacterioplanes sp.]|nr:AraC family transcriptional regulator [Bacterioplanes sp.]